MRDNGRYAVLAVLALAGIGLLVLSQSAPLLYAVEKDIFPSRFHDNPEALKLQALNSTTDVLPLMQDLLDFTGPVALNIRIRDIEEARRDLGLFAKSHGSFNSLIIKLDMSEGELKEFSKSSSRQREILDALLNSSVSFDALKQLEIQYRDNAGMLVSVQLQQDAIRSRIRNLVEEYQTETKKVTELSRKYGLDSSPEEESVRELDAYLREIDVLEERTDFPIRRSAQLSFLISPDSGKYGDVIEGFGYVFSLYGYRVQGAEGKQVTIFIDNEPVSTVMTDAVGSYTVRIPIERIPAGTHFLHAESGISQSDVRTLTIYPVDSVTSLSVSPPTNRGDVLCTGSVVANRPVRSAPVIITWDAAHEVVTTTNANGEFRTTIRLPNGKHTVVARFSGRGYPVNPSESASQVVDVSIIAPEDYTWIILLVMAAGILVISAGGAWYYLRRSHMQDPIRDLLARSTGTGDAVIPGIERPSDRDAIRNEPAEQIPPAAPAPESLSDQYFRILRGEGLSAAARSVYAVFSKRVARELNIPRHASLTPRELSRSCKKMPFCPPFSSLVLVYERIRYGGVRSAAVQAEFEDGMRETGTALGGRDH